MLILKFASPRIPTDKFAPSPPVINRNTTGLFLNPIMHPYDASLHYSQQQSSMGPQVLLPPLSSSVSCSLLPVQPMSSDISQYSQSVPQLGARSNYFGAPGNNLRHQQQQQQQQQQQHQQYTPAQYNPGHSLPPISSLLALSSTAPVESSNDSPIYNSSSFTLTPTQSHDSLVSLQMPLKANDLEHPSYSGVTLQQPTTTAASTSSSKQNSPPQSTISQPVAQSPVQTEKEQEQEQEQTSTSPKSGEVEKKLVRKYQCKTCTKSFTTSGHLARHVRIHTGERKHQCPFPGCESRFARQDNCMQHFRTHQNKLKKRRSVEMGTAKSLRDRTEPELRESRRALTSVFIHKPSDQVN
ncbi:hypothetical protein WICPIJ_009650 [Wickerhamomyces pijperi]|uniref:C2H2-type domain-containing protein n=1 Tax=Wickerhamomyces pijperi TaxID=599730 RepID=A0A9P8PLL5_WICPI|nr:hypothetical protein WICPIJ_009650 [Wickerhamomyces pijperi]